MILNRIGNKKKIAKKIQCHFPFHKVYVEPFFGAGGMFFSKPQVEYNIVNDNDSDVFNLFQVLMNHTDELTELLKIMPIHADLMKYWIKNKETDPAKKALRFLFMSNFLLYGKNGTLQIGAENRKKIILSKIKKTLLLLQNVYFANSDFRKFLNSDINNVIFKREMDILIYADPPYLDSVNNYLNGFTKQDSIDLFDCLQKTGCKFAMSEFNNEFILEQAKERNLNIITIGERKTLKNRRIEILITNYPEVKTLFD